MKSFRQTFSTFGPDKTDLKLVEVQLLSGHQGKRSVLQNPDRGTTNQSTGICLRLALPYNKNAWHTHLIEIISGARKTGETLRYNC